VLLGFRFASWLLFVAVMCGDVGYIIINSSVTTIVEWQVSILLLLLSSYTGQRCVAGLHSRVKNVLISDALIFNSLRAIVRCTVMLTLCAVHEGLVLF